MKWFFRIDSIVRVVAIAWGLAFLVAGLLYGDYGVAILGAIVAVAGVLYTLVLLRTRRVVEVGIVGTNPAVRYTYRFWRFTTRGPWAVQLVGETMETPLGNLTRTA